MTDRLPAIIHNSPTRRADPFLHVELCHDRAIDFAISRGSKRVEAGAQGRHKVQRGYLPQETFSADWIAHGGFSRAMANFLREEQQDVRAEMAALMEHSPFRREGE